MLLWCERTSIELRLIILEMIYTYSCLRKLELCRNNGVYISPLRVTLGFAFPPLPPPLPIIVISIVLSSLHSSLYFFLLSLLFCVLLMPRMTLFTHPSEVCYGRYDMGYATSRTTSINQSTYAITQPKIPSVYPRTQIN